MSYQQYKSLDKNLIFAEYFNSEQEVRRNGGVPEGSEGVTFNNGMATFTGNNSWMSLGNMPIPLQGIYSIRIKFRIPVSTTNDLLADFRGSGSGGSRYISVIDTPDRVSTQGGTFTQYIDGVINIAAYTPDTWHELVVSGWDINVAGLIWLAANYADAAELACDIGLFEIYSGTLTQEEVTNLYNDARYVVPNLEHAAQGDGVDMNVSDCENFSYTTFSDSTPTGFSAASNGVANQYAGSADEVQLIITQRYILAFDLTLNSGVLPTVSIANFLGSSTSRIKEGWLTCSEGLNSFEITAEITTLGAISFRTDTASVNYTISNLSIQNLTVEPTKEILNVNAFDGVARNRLSGDSTKVPFMDTGKGSFADGTTESWATYGTNGMEIDSDGSLKITYVDNSLGANTGLKEASDLNQNLVIGNLYRCHVVAKRNAGNAKFYIIGPGIESGELTTEFKEYIIEFIATSSTSSALAGRSMSAGEILWIKSWFIEEIIPEVTNTAIEVVKEGAVRVPRFNGSSSRIDCGSYNDLTGDITVLAWIRSNKYEGDDQYIFSNGQFYVRTDNLKYLRTSSDDSITTSTTLSDSLKNATWQLFAMPRRADGFVVDMYIDAVNVLGVRNTGTPVAGDKIEIGRDDAGSKPWNGEISEVKVIEGLLTPAEISQYFSSTKHLYNK